VLGAQRLADHLTGFEWPSPDEGAIDVTEPAAGQAWLAAQRAALELKGMATATLRRGRTAERRQAAHNCSGQSATARRRT
jgi:hypothetical protein